MNVLKYPFFICLFKKALSPGVFCAYSSYQMLGFVSFNYQAQDVCTSVYKDLLFSYIEAF